MSVGAWVIITAVVAGGLGWLIGWLMGVVKGRGHTPPTAAADDRLEAELRQQLSQRDKELSGTRAELSGLREQWTRGQTALATAQAAQNATETMLATEKRRHEEVMAEVRVAQDKALADLRDTFKALSAEALRQSAPDFLRLAEQTFGKLQETAKGELGQRQEAIRALVEPLKQQLETYQLNLQQNATAQSASLGEVKKQLTLLSEQSGTLARETQQFRMVLNSNQARGKWGEETLRRVVEAAGMSAHCDFTEQTQAGDNRPDLVVRLPGDRMIIVDAKVPDLDFLNALSMADETRRAEALTAHAQKFKETIRNLAARDYPSEFPKALDYVVLFVPAESLFSAALEGDHDLLVWAAEKRILLATPASLIALLRSVAVSWQQHAQTENAQKIAEAANELFQRIITFTEHLEKIRGGLESANKAFNQAVGSYESRVRPAGDKLQKLGGTGAGKALDELPLLDGTLRLPPG